MAAKQNNLSYAQFHDPEAARSYLERLMWPQGPVCPKCGAIGGHYTLKTRPGMWKCKDCRKQFSVTVGTVFERSHIPLHKWLFAVYLMASSKKGVSSHQLHRTLQVTYKTAWFMTHRLREAMTSSTFLRQLGGGGGVVEVDETYWGRDPIRRDTHAGGHHKLKIFSLVERGGEVRSFHIPRVNARTLKPIMLQQIAQDTHVMTDQAPLYKTLMNAFAQHSSVNHSLGEYVRGDVTTNTVEGYFSILKRGLIGTFHHVGPQHLQRYMHEFDFRYNHRVKLGFNDQERADIMLNGIKGKRLTYKRTAKQQVS
jgi:transposase-like protein